jgi:hypothetical protein
MTLKKKIVGVKNVSKKNLKTKTQNFVLSFFSKNLFAIWFNWTANKIGV